jgi:outer membrane immunogenic protein
MHPAREKVMLNGCHFDKFSRHGDRDPARQICHTRKQNKPDGTILVADPPCKRHRAVGGVTLKKGQAVWGFPMKWAAVVAGVALACTASLSGRAADVTPLPPTPYKAAPTYMPAYFSWTGYYMGVMIGDGFGKATFFDPFAGGATASPSLKGFLGGGYTGVNYQVGSVVFGMDGDFLAAWSEGSANDTVGDSLKVDVAWTASVAARLGWAFDRLLPFAKAGAAFVYHRDAITGAGPPGSPSGSATSAGWTVGGGMDWAVTEHWIARVEYDYLKLPMKALLVSAPNGGAQVGIKLNEIKGGFAYKF